MDLKEECKIEKRMEYSKCKMQRGKKRGKRWKRWEEKEETIFVRVEMGENDSLSNKVRYYTNI